MCIGRGRTSTVLGASFNFINSIVGAGIIGLPYAIKECGFFTGVFCLVMVAVIVNYSGNNDNNYIVQYNCILYCIL